ncbi:MAG: hypothetical protein ACTSRG_26955 [Candidatus Helarchaeota archaeon]
MMRNIYIRQGIVKLPRPRQLYCGFAISGNGSWSKSRFLKNRMNDTFQGRIKQRRVK